MPTTELRSCRIHHNSGFDGDIYITNNDSTSKLIGKRATISLSFEELIDIYNGCLKTNSKRRNLTIKSTIKDHNSEDPEITVLKQDILDFVAYVLRCKIESKLDQMSNKNIERLAAFLKIGV